MSLSLSFTWILPLIVGLSLAAATPASAQETAGALGQSSQAPFWSQLVRAYGWFKQNSQQNSSGQVKRGKAGRPDLRAAAGLPPATVPPHGTRTPVAGPSHEVSTRKPQPAPGLHGAGKDLKHAPRKSQPNSSNNVRRMRGIRDVATVRPRPTNSMHRPATLR